MISPRFPVFVLVLFLFSGLVQQSDAQDVFGPEGLSERDGVPVEGVPEPLQPWVKWALKDAPGIESPRIYSDAAKRLPLWSSRLQFDATATGAKFSFGVTAFEESWLALPGSARAWPEEVAVDGQLVPVVERGGRPAIQLQEGDAVVSGSFRWPELPQQIKLPPAIGLLALTVDGNPQGNPSWDADGTLWLQRQASTEPVDEDFLSIKVHSLLEDGIPLWFETRIELIVAGKSREETLGSVLPQGWQLAEIKAPIPVAIDDRGLLKAQLRAGRWSISMRAFQTDQVESVSFAEGATPAVQDESLAFRAQPDFRQAELTGMPQIDVAQTQVPEEWRSLPIYRWDTAGSFSLVERVRGPGERGTSPLTIQRSLWLDDDGKMLTYQDTLSGPVRKIRRLDAAEGHLLGSVSVAGEPQLITHNPVGNAPGFEVRAPQLSAVATGRLAMDDTLSATGWQANADGLRVSLQLPPGYRLLALFGADYSSGDWLTSWTLLDLFLLLLFTLAVFRLRGLAAALLAFAAFGLAYHESGAPRFPWLFLLIPVALVTFMPEGKWRKVAVGFKWGIAGILLISLLPFVAFQIQGAVFPQLERRAAFSSAAIAADYAAPQVRASTAPVLEREAAQRKSKPQKWSKKENLKADPKAIIQTGPGVPTWSWRTVEFGWQGPVSSSETVNPVLIPPLASRLIAVLRVLCLVGLAALLLSARRKKPKTDDLIDNGSGSKPAAAVALLIAGIFSLGFPGNADAQLPGPELLKELRDRLIEPSEAFPGAAEIASADMAINEGNLTLILQYHTAARTAVPVPLPLSACVPSSATLNDGTPATLLRKDGQLWALMPDKGIHTLTVNGRLRGVTDWEWGFTLKPRRFTVSADGWSVSGIRPDGSAEDQILFSQARGERGSAASANYDRPETNHALLVERQIELGLVWRVQTTVSRLSPGGRAVVVKIPVLSGEKVVSAGRSVEGGAIEIRLAPDAESVSWEGELSPTDELTLATRETDGWTEQWRLVASPVWNVSFTGLNPTFVVREEQLVPLWQPWPGETASITVSRPKAVEGSAVTIDSADYLLKPGRRQRTSTLTLSLRTSLGEDFAIGLPTGAEVVSLTHVDRSIPIRKEGGAVVVPLRPGAQTIKLEWRRPGEDKGWTRADPVMLPVESANVRTLIRPTNDRWLILTDGPLRGPAVRFWGVFAFILIAAFVLSRVPGTPLSLLEWLLLSLGLTQIPVYLSLMVVAWLFLIRWRGSPGFQNLRPGYYNLCQGILIFLTLISLGIFIGIASSGLLGDPEMYVAGNGSTASYLQWFTARSPAELPQPGYWAISIWWFRLAMLLWALWLASALVRWLRRGWKNSAKGGHFKPFPKRAVKKAPSPPELPKQG